MLRRTTAASFAVVPMSLSSSASSKRSGGSLVMDMDSIRERRAKLQSILNAMRPPALTPESSTFVPRWRRHQQASSPSTIDHPALKSLIPKASTFKSSTQPLPEIVKRDSNSNNSRQAMRERSRQPPPTLRAPDQTGKSRHLDDVKSDLEDADFTHEFVEEIVRGIGSNSRKRRLKNTVRARRLLSVEANPPIQEFLKAGILRPLIPHVQQRQDSTLQLEATWALTNLASGTLNHTAAVVDGGAVAVLVEALSGGDERVAEQAAWALGNIVGEQQFRNLVVSMGVVAPLLAALHSGRASSSSYASTSSSSSSIDAPVSLVRVVTWVLANIFRHKGLVMKQQERQSCINALKTLLCHTDSAVILDALWATGYIAAGDDEGQQEVVAAGIVPDLVRHLGAKERQKIIPALKATANLLMGSDHQTDAVVAAGVLPLYRRLLVSPHHNLRKEVSWALSNITAGNKNQIQKVIDEGFLPHLMEVIGQNHLDVQREAVWVLTNLVNGGSLSQVEAVVSAGGAAALTSVLAVSETGTVGVAINALENILKTPELRKEALRQVRVAQGVQRLEALQGYVDNTIKERATGILDTYFQDGHTGPSLSEPDGT